MWPGSDCARSLAASRGLLGMSGPCIVWCFLWQRCGLYGAWDIYIIEASLALMSVHCSIGIILRRYSSNVEDINFTSTHKLGYNNRIWPQPQNASKICDIQDWRALRNTQLLQGLFALAVSVGLIQLISKGIFRFHRGIRCSGTPAARDTTYPTHLVRHSTPFSSI